MGWGLCGHYCEKDAERGCVKENKYTGKQCKREIRNVGLGSCVATAVRKTERGCVKETTLESRGGSERLRVVTGVTREREGGCLVALIWCCVRVPRLTMYTCFDAAGAE